MRPALWLAALSLLSVPQSPQTTPERTDYRQTSTYADVVRFLGEIQSESSLISVQYIGVSEGGRRIPLVIAADPPVAGPADARRSGKPIIYIQANIHGGEVEGKEAVQKIIRELAQGELDWLDKAIFLFTPIYNIDGNENWGDGSRNRPSQDGPERVGQRANGQGFDLNRDCIKAESPEMRAVLEHVYNAWDPDVGMDLHTTNGTRHGYGLTYSPPLSPMTEPTIFRYSRDELLPNVRRKLRESGLETFDYGNAGRGENARWSTFGYEPRYVTNYMGLRNRIGILSEATSYWPFRERIEATEMFVKAVVEEVLKDPARILKMTRDADMRVIEWGLNPEAAPELGVRFQMESRGIESVLLERQGAQRTGMKPADLESVIMPIYDRFKPTRTARFPAGYLILPGHDDAVQLLLRHGIIVEKLTATWSGRTWGFEIAQMTVAAQAFQGRHLVTIEGSFTLGPADFGEGSYLVRTAQPLGILAFNLLEPESMDGVAAWGFLGDSLGEGKQYPIYKLPQPLSTPTERIVR